ncbi:MAG: hypothetical protein AB8G96_02575 [Phycisphaerales bacterium]
MVRRMIIVFFGLAGVVMLLQFAFFGGLLGGSPAAAAWRYGGGALVVMLAGLMLDGIYAADDERVRCPGCRHDLRAAVAAGRLRCAECGRGTPPFMQPPPATE